MMTTHNVKPLRSIGLAKAKEAASDLPGNGWQVDIAMHWHDVNGKSSNAGVS
jgi:hypothetical protein